MIASRLGQRGSAEIGGAGVVGETSKDLGIAEGGQDFCGIAVAVMDVGDIARRAEMRDSADP